MTNEQQQILDRIGRFLESCRYQTDENLMRQTTAGPALREYHGLGSRPEKPYGIFADIQELERRLLKERNKPPEATKKDLDPVTGQPLPVIPEERIREAARNSRRHSLPTGVSGTICVVNDRISIVKNEANGSTSASIQELSTSAMQEAARILSAWLCIPADSMFFGFTHSWPDRPGVWAVKCVHMPDSAPYDITIIRSPTKPPEVSHFRYGYICQLPVIGQPVATNPPPKTRF